MKKRILSLLMVLTLCLSLLPTMALAKGSTRVNVTGVETSSGNGASTMTLEGTFEAEDGTKSVKLTFMLNVEYESGTRYETGQSSNITLASAKIDGMDAGNVKNASITVTRAKSGGLLEIIAHMAVGKYENAPLSAHWDNYQEHDDVKFEPWMPTEETPLPTEAGNYYLTDDVTLNETWTVPAGTTNLCLNGHVIKLADGATGSVINALGNATLNLYDCNDDAWPHLFAYSKTGAWKLLESYEGEAPVTIDEITSATEDGTAVLVEGGVITGGNANNAEINQYGGGVYVNDGTFNMYGGSIVGNSAGHGGGVGVYDDEDGQSASSFTMYGGSIVGNISEDAGGGVTVRAESSFTMYGGSIAKNISGAGGGVRVFGSFTMYGGSIEKNKAGSQGGGVQVNSPGSFTMYGGTIIGNSGGEGGGVSVYTRAVFVMEGGSITGNKAEYRDENVTGLGGGVFVYENAVFAMAGGSITGNTADGNGDGVYVYYNYHANECLAEGSLITMASGERKPVEDLQQGDVVRVFDHESGEPSTAPIGFVVRRSKPLYGAFTLHFSDGIDVTPVKGRSFYDQQENRYVILTDANAEEYIGHAFYDLDTDCWRTLDSVTHIAEPVTAYALVTKDVLNCAATGMLSCEDDIVAAFANVFAFDADMKVDQAQKQADIEKWGLATYEEYDYVSRDFFEAFPSRYVNIVIGKGLATAEEIESSVTALYSQLSGYADATNESRMTLGAPVLSLFSAPAGAAPEEKIKVDMVKSLTTNGVSGGILLGGTAKIYGNGTGNVYLAYCAGNETATDSKITIGTGPNGNGVIAPAPGMTVGVTNDSNATNTICLSAAEDDEKYFFADAPDTYVVFDDTENAVLKLDAITSGHKVIVSQSEGGTVYTDKQAAAEDETVTLTVVPENGYVLKSLKYNDGTDHDIVADAQGAYKFTMPNTAVTVAAVFAPSWGKLNAALAGTQGTLDGLFTVADNAGVRTIKLLTDFTAGEDDFELTVPSDRKTVLDLNGHVLDRGLTSKANRTDDDLDRGTVIVMIEDGDLTITDGNPTAPHNFTVLTSGEYEGLWMLDEENGTEEVTGGVITGGVGYNSGGVLVGRGAGEHIWDIETTDTKGSVTMTGGNIIGNIGGGEQGGGVRIYEGSFTMSGVSRISGNYSALGGGVYAADNTTFVMDGGAISENVASEYGGGVYVTCGAQFTMNDGAIKNNACVNTDDDFGLGGGVYMSSDGDQTQFTMEDGEISGNEANRGGGVYVGYQQHFHMKGGSITDNIASPYDGGGVYDFGTFLMDDGEISGNEARRGGGVYVVDPGVFTVSSADITGNTANEWGGGICNDIGTVNLTAPAGKQITITGNTAARTGGGVWKNHALSMSGKVIIKDNICPLGFTNLVKSYDDGETISITDALTGSEIYVSVASTYWNDETEEWDGAFWGELLTDGYTDSNPGAGLTDFFHYEGDPAKCRMILNGDGELEIIEKQYIWNRMPLEDRDTNNGYLEVVEEEFAGEQVTVKVYPNSGYQLKTLWYRDGDWYDVTAAKAFTMPTRGTQVSAEFEPIPAPTPSGGGSTPTVTVPVTGDGNKVNVSASVSGSTATVKAITDAELDKVTGGEAVEINLTGLKKDINTAKIPTATVEKIGDKGGMSVKLTTATVTFDKAATQEISAQAGGNTIQLVVDDIKEVSLNAVQKEAVKKLDTALIIDAYLVSNGTRLCSESKGGFNGGKATVALPFEIKNNRTSANYSVYYVDDAGNLEKLNAKYDSKLGAFVFDITHFSNYVVAYDENAALAFTDVPVDQYFYNAVKWAAANGITEGTSATTFSPYAPVTRAQVVTFLWRTAGCPEPKGDASKFVDVKVGSYYEKAVAWAIEQVITKGTSETTFSPDAVCTRGQIVTFLARFAGVADDATGYTHGFTDVKATDYYNNAVAWAKDNKVTEGTSATTFSPKQDCTRAQVVTFLYRYMSK